MDNVGADKGQPVNSKHPFAVRDVHLRKIRHLERGYPRVSQATKSVLGICAIHLGNSKSHGGLYEHLLSSGSKREKSSSP